MQLAVQEIGGRNSMAANYRHHAIACRSAMSGVPMWLLLISVAASALAAAPPAASQTRPAPAATYDTSADPAVDPLFAHPYIDKDEWRNTPVRHRYVHGGFKGTD